MARFRVWDERANRWWDCMDVPMFVRHNDTWVPLIPGRFKVRNQHGERWHDVDDTFDPTYDDPCAVVDTEGCNGSPTSKTRGSGNGMGSGGPSYDQLKGYPPGYDLPDAGRSGFGLVLNGAAPTGRAINRPGINRQESYDPSGSGSRAGLGTYANPNLPYNSVSGRGARITETVYALPQKEGVVEINFASYDKYGMSVDVYHMGQRVASTCGPVTGRGRISFQFDSHTKDQRVMIRTRGEQGATWSLNLYPPRLIATTDRGNLSLDYQLAYDAIRFPDIINEQYIGSPVFPASCHATVHPIPERIANTGAFEYFHYMGAVAGRVIIDYASWGNFDYFEVYHGGVRIATTLDPVTSYGQLIFNYDPKGSLVQDIMVRVVGADFKPGSGPETQFYSIYCPSARGSYVYRHACEAYTIESGGHTTTEDWIDLGMQADRRGVAIQVTSGNFDTTFQVFTSDRKLIDTEFVPAHKTGTLEFWKDPWEQNKAFVMVRATSVIGSDWRYFVWCPVQPPALEHRDLLLTYNCLEVGDQTTEWSMDRAGVIEYAANMDHNLDINFQAVTARGDSWEGAGYNRDWIAGGQSVGGQLFKSNESRHGDLWSRTAYRPVADRFGTFVLDRVEMTLSTTGTTAAWIAQMPTRENGWMARISLQEHDSGEHWCTANVSLKVYYRTT